MLQTQMLEMKTFSHFSRGLMSACRNWTCFFFILVHKFAPLIFPRYVESNPQYAKSSVYLLKFRQVQSQVLGMIRSHVLSVLKGAFSQVQAAIRCTGDSKTSISEGVEASVIYDQFKTASSENRVIFLVAVNNYKYLQSHLGGN